jgi:hypothetical protein
LAGHRLVVGTGVDPVTSDEHALRPGPLRHVLAKHRHDMGRDGHGSSSRVRLRGSVKGCARFQQLDAIPAHGHGARLEVDVFAVQREHFTTP